MPKISQDQKDARRQRILDAALVCFARDGFHNTTTADLVRESGVSQGALYLYFAGKDDIILALADDRHQSEAMLSALAQKEQDPVRGLARLIELHGRGLGDPERLAARGVGVQGWGEAIRNPKVKAAVLEGLDSVREAITRLIERGQHTGQIRVDIDPAAFARTLIAVFHGFVLQAVWGEAIDLHACGQVLWAMIGEGLLTDAGRASWRETTDA